MNPNLLEQHAVVTRVEPGAAWIEAREPASCGTCGGNGCSTRLLAELFRRKLHCFRVEDPLGVKPGEMVWVGYPAGSVWHGALSAYGLPLVLVLLGGLLGQLGTGGDGGAALGAALGLSLGLVGLLFLGRKGGSVPVILRRDGESAVTFTPTLLSIK